MTNKQIKTAAATIKKLLELAQPEAGTGLQLTSTPITTDLVSNALYITLNACQSDGTDVQIRVAVDHTSGRTSWIRREWDNDTLEMGDWEPIRPLAEARS